MHTSLYTPPVLVSPLPSISSRAISLANRNGRPKKSARGAFVATKGPRRLIYFESALEYKIFLLLSARPDVEEIQEQQVVSYVDQNGRLTTHTFDARLKRKSDDVLVAVRPYELAMRKGFPQLLELIGKQVPRSFASQVVLITERDCSAAELHNAELIHASRLDADADGDALIRDIVGSVREPISVKHLVERAGEDRGRSFRAVVRLIANSELTMPEPGRIAYSTIVVPEALGTGEVR